MCGFACFGEVVGMGDVVFGERMASESRHVGGINIPEDNVRVGGHGHVAAPRSSVSFRKRGFVACTAVFEVLDAALGDVDAAEEFAVGLFVPAELIGRGVEGVFPWGVKGGVGMGFDLIGKPVEAFVFGRDTSCAIVCGPLAVSVVALDFDDGFGDGDSLFAIDVGEGFGEDRGGCWSCRGSCRSRRRCRGCIRGRSQFSRRGRRRCCVRL